MITVKIKCWNCGKWSEVLTDDLSLVYKYWTCVCGAGIDREKQKLIIARKGNFIVPREVEKHEEKGD